MLHVPVIIIGGGPAGAATAISLRQQGVDCLLVESSETPSLKPGETLPPNAGIVLQKLGLWEHVHHNEHALCTGNLIYWGTDLLQSRQFFSEPNGNGWHLDRSFFEKQLQEEAILKAVNWLSGWRCISVEHENNNWRMTCKNAAGSLQVFSANFIVEASGRSSRIARMMKIPRQSFDRLTGYYAQLNSVKKIPPSSTFIESTPDGWWYAMQLKSGRTIINFMSDADLHHTDAGSLQNWIFNQLQHTEHLKQYLAINDPADLITTLIKPASVSKLQHITGTGWLAVGDAAFSYDPLSSYGITAALGGGIYAGLAIASLLNGNEEALDAYSFLQYKAFENCQVMLRHQYSLETRWSEAVFWKRRTTFVRPGGP